jgi:hypothetical protein
MAPYLAGTGALGKSVHANNRQNFGRSRSYKIQSPAEGVEFWQERAPSTYLYGNNYYELTKTNTCSILSPKRHPWNGGMTWAGHNCSRGGHASREPPAPGPVIPEDSPDAHLTEMTTSTG